MASLSFLAHTQLHEVLFDFLTVEDVLSYRTIHTACDDVMVHYAKAKLQDVIGQDICPSLPFDANDSSEKEEIINRTIDARFVNLLAIRGDDIGYLFLESGCGVRSLSAKLIRRTTRLMLVAALKQIFGAISEDSAQGLLHVDVFTHLDAVPDGFVPMIATHSTQLRSLNIASHNTIKDDTMRLVATNCRQLESLNISYSIPGGTSLTSRWG